MANSPEEIEAKNNGLWRNIILAWLLVGTLDITCASIQTLIYGRDVINLFKFVASGFFGEEASKGGMEYAFYGLAFHYFIAFSWTTLFFLVYPKLKLWSINRIVTGIGYGLFIWLVMNRVVLKLSNIPPFPFRLMSAVIGASILIVAIGIPLSFLANRFYSSRHQ
jgi:hypothetical protein